MKDAENLELFDAAVISVGNAPRADTEGELADPFLLPVASTVTRRGPVQSSDSTANQLLT